MLIATDSKLLRELPKEGARLIPPVREGIPVVVSDRRTRRVATTSCWSDSLEVEHADLRKAEGLTSESPEFSVIELGVEGIRDGGPRVGDEE